ncbi:MAG: permease [Candidatus Electryonea clarkiae]|nr:permease [Candidatus Electryonea clarkiae]MDP8286245.1 permease [Candidatus Electryonea clarkiae]
MLTELLLSGWEALTEYLSAHVLTCLVPAFFIAGAIAVFVSQTAVIRYFGPRAKRWLSYTVASLSGAILAVCSCTILPLFAGIRQRGAGLGPAIAFLYSGPAINVLAIIYSAQLLGFDIGIARAVGAISFSVVIGLIMAVIFRKQEEKLYAENTDWAYGEDEDDGSHPLSRIIPYFAAMVIFLVAASSIGLVVELTRAESGRWSMIFEGKPVPALISVVFLAAVIIMVVRWYSGNEVALWMQETWSLVKKIVPILLIGVFVAGMIKVLLPEPVVQRWVGGNSIWNNLLASVFGALMYFSTLTEVPIVRALMDLGMGRGPALTLLLAGPSLSLPNMIVIGRVMGVKRTAVYVVLVVVLSTFVGMIFGRFAG